MSAGDFSSDAKYEDNAGLIYRIRVQPETLALTDGTTANASPAGAITEKVRARARLGRREYGVRARYVTVRFTGTLPDGYSGEDLNVPVMTQAAFNAYTATVGVTGTYLGAPIEFIGGENEKIR
jgi:hypothetical protein